LAQAVLAETPSWRVRRTKAARSDEGKPCLDITTSHGVSEIVLMISRRRGSSGLVQYLRFPETLRNALDVFLASKGLPADVFGECVVWVDLFELPPNPARLLELAEMTEGRSEKSARKIRAGHEHNPLPEQSGRCFVLSCKQICHTEEVEELRT
jgi:hypothetical protein